MTEFWKSGARHWCTYCKIFINGTKPSIAYHENGKKHKEIVEMSLKAMRERARERGKEKKELEGELAKIENAAMKHYQRHDAPGSSSSDAGRPPIDGDRASRLAALEQQIEASKLLRSSVGPGGLPLGWRMQTNPDGAVYYEHVATGTMQWEPPQGTVSVAAEEPPAAVVEAEQGDAADTLPAGWQRGAAPDGKPYYYNAELGLTQWSYPEEEAQDADGGVGGAVEGGAVAEDAATEDVAAEGGATEDGAAQGAEEVAEEAEAEEEEEPPPDIDTNTGLGVWTVVEDAPEPEFVPEPVGSKRSKRSSLGVDAGKAEGRKKKKVMRFTRLDDDGEEQPQELMDHLQEHYPMPEEMRAAMARAAEAEASEETAGPVVFNKRRSDKSGFRRKKPGL